MKSLIIDASSAILLYKSGLFLDLLHHYRVLCVERVFAEMTRSGYTGADTFARLYRKRKFKVIQPPDTVPHLLLTTPAPARLHQGERDTLTAFLDDAADFILTDDGRAASFCRNANIPYTCALLCPRILYHAGLISPSACSIHTDSILAIGRYSKSVVAYALECPPQNLDFFIPAA